ncbi:inositol hexakisphosphate-domain-containing protein [Desarmillaria tabescens]|uniref:Inositol hexakisphosphate-domain-containing protein n=1 Tax=Armillaria tabescens TaxID=1929756 RepID=A0AA39NQ11_ARMTA|nr:inositol hexakisphosphate-domain-containing protein [Desarmillaria tabescens]KAK0469504.1 inositol hexakisphosphate-domain-containing protein [Desarmillaria tabescens]
MGSLYQSEPSVVKTRNGSVLSRGFILKTDHYPSVGRALDLDLNVHGAPNFRAPRIGNLNVFGVAQPRTQGLRAILSVLRCTPNTSDPSHVVWFSTREEPIVYISGRPFVLRDASEPKRTLSLSDRAENLEAIELRLKNDILHEASRFGGLLLTHNEMATDSGEGAILPTWTAVDTNNVKTSRELWNFMKESGWNVDYHRIPISPDRPIEASPKGLFDNYLDAYLRVIKQTDPLRTSLVFSCGMGAVRTTFAMVAASIVRRKQLISKGLPDPYPAKGFQSTSGTNSIVIHVQTYQDTESRLLQSMEQANTQQELSKSLLRLTYLLQHILQDKNSQSAIELLITQPTLLENLRRAHMGNYGIILSLLGCLDQGLQAKKLVDRIIDAADHVTNLREDILIHRIKYSLISMEGEKGEVLIEKSRRALEKYFFIIAFASYVDSSEDFSESFSDWLKARIEIWNQVMFLRKSFGTRLNVFAPVNDLSSLSKSGSEGRALVPGRNNDVAIAGGQILGDEFSTHVIKHRSGIILRESTLLKSDQWFSQGHSVDDGVRGAINFRRVPGTNVYALGQPTIEAIDEVVGRIKDAHPSAQRVIWITLREEPIIYINGAPYCLRREGFSLRNMKDYGGISASRLEVLEQRLRDDVVSEGQAFGGRVLLHSETADGTVVPIWEEVEGDNVVVLKDVMTSRKSTQGIELVYDRIPITAERPPDFSDLSEMIDVVLRSSRDTPIVVNCQLGRGRSTLASIILLLIRQWLDSCRTPQTPHFRLQRTISMSTMSPIEHTLSSSKRRQSYQVINNLLRVFRKGLDVKNIVDDAIDQCDVFYNLRESIEENRIRAEQATDEKQKKLHTQKALHNLRRYFDLIVFQAYLQSTEPDTMDNFESVETFVKNRPVIKTFEKELLADGINALKPLEQSNLTQGVAHPDEVHQVVTNRSGSILSASTILKSDFFSNLQKMTLPERIEGSPNFRRIPLTLLLSSSGESTPTVEQDQASIAPDGKMVCGSGMPTVDGLRRALKRVDAGFGGQNMVYWTSLREEPVIYVAGRPHVLRLVDKPLENVEATGVTTAMVEAMEQSFKKDVLRELRIGKGRILLHDEVEERPGVFSIIPLWEEVEEKDILTPRDVFDLMTAEGFKLDYGRIAITDEQAPLPDALSLLLERVKSGLSKAGDFIFNCQMGRGRTTTGMVTACLISTIMNWNSQANDILSHDEAAGVFDSMDGYSEEEVYRRGEYKTILQLVGVLSHGKVAKRLADRAIDQMQDVQNLRKTIYDYKLKVDACEKGSLKERKLRNVTVNYLYRYGMLIVFANYLIEVRESKVEIIFAEWLSGHREITNLLSRRSLD